MIKIYLDEKLRAFENDIKDLCIAFFKYEEVEIIYDTKENNNKIIIDEDEHLNVDKRIVNFYNGKIYNNRKKTKDAIKRSLYAYLSKMTHRTLPYGTLTGIRPVNIVTEKLESDEYDINKMDVSYINKIKKQLKRTYLISKDKINELIYIALKEETLLQSDDVKDYKEKISCYVGVPFCKSTCLYCSFTSFNIDKWQGYPKRYLQALENELKERMNTFDKEKILTLYIGGGTPTSLCDEDFETLLKIVHKYLYHPNVIEYTIEAGRPDTINENKLRLMKEYFVTRISINPQTFNKKTLTLIGRKHTIKDIKEKFKLARELNFDNINMDVIMGLPKEDEENFCKTLKEIVSLSPESVTVHSLSLKRASRLNVEKDNFIKYYWKNKDSDKKYLVMQATANAMLSLIDLEPYYLYRQKNMVGNLSNIGFAKKGYECIYNIMMMSERHTVLGFGLSVSKIIEYKGDEKIITRVPGYKGLVEYVNKWEK